MDLVDLLEYLITAGKCDTDSWNEFLVSFDPPVTMHEFPLAENVYRSRLHLMVCRGLIFKL